MDRISAMTAIAISSGDSAPMFNPIGHRTWPREDGWIPTSMHDSVNDFHFERLPIAPIRGKAFPSGKTFALFCKFQQPLKPVKVFGIIMTKQKNVRKA